MKEIEHKFLVDLEKWEKVKKPKPSAIVQGYLSRGKECTVRIRIKNKTAYLTIKGKTEGISRDEFEYQIPMSDAQFMLANMIDNVLRKKRYTIINEDRIWEVDVFEGKLQGLILAELEVKSENEKFALPEWVTQDVSMDPNYFNAILIDRC